MPTRTGTGHEELVPAYIRLDSPTTSTGPDTMLDPTSSLTARFSQTGVGGIQRHIHVAKAGSVTALMLAPSSGLFVHNA
jgi:hypothetical protein